MLGVLCIEYAVLENDGPDGIPTNVSEWEVVGEVSEANGPDGMLLVYTDSIPYSGDILLPNLPKNTTTNLHPLTVRALVVVLVEHVHRHVHPLAHDLDRDAVVQRLGDRTAPNVVWRDCRRTARRLIAPSSRSAVVRVHFRVRTRPPLARARHGIDSRSVRTLREPSL